MNTHRRLNCNLGSKHFSTVRSLQRQIQSPRPKCSTVLAKLILFILVATFADHSREIFIKTDNYIDGVFFADLLKVDKRCSTSRRSNVSLASLRRKWCRIWRTANINTPSCVSPSTGKVPTNGTNWPNGAWRIPCTRRMSDGWYKSLVSSRSPSTSKDLNSWLVSFSSVMFIVPMESSRIFKSFSPISFNRCSKLHSIHHRTRIYSASCIIWPVSTRWTMKPNRKSRL